MLWADDPSSGPVGAEGPGAAVLVRPMQRQDWEPVAEIYREGIASGGATFETTVPSWEAWDSSRLPRNRLVAESADQVVGWAALSPVSDRCVYSGVADVSVYVAESAQGRGVGRQLLQALIAGSEQDGIWTLQAGMFPENTASVRLHVSCGFRIVGRRQRIGRLGDTWRDVLFMERRSAVAGTDAE